jgi:nicotinamidase-related amidase
MACALLVIDVQNDYFPGGLLPLHEAQHTETAIAAAILRARKAGDRIILVRHVAPVGSGLLARGSSGIDIRPAILSAAGDASVVTKSLADAFQDTDLADHLTGIDRLLICGMMTQNCVVFTALSQAASDFDVQVIADLCAAPSPIVHRIALHALGSKLPVVTSDTLWR